MSGIQPQPINQEGKSPDWLEPANVDAAMISSDVKKAAQQLDRISGIGIDPKKAKEVGGLVLPSEVSQKADWPGGEITDNTRSLPETSDSDWY
jgi:hypothetical protein